MVVIHTTEDFIKAMDENPEWLEAVRARLLPREVLELPRRFEELRAVVEQLAATQNRILAEQAEMKAEQAEMKAAQNRMLAAQNRMLATQNEILATLKEHTATQKLHTDDLAPLKGDRVEKDLGRQIFGMLGGYPLRMRLVKVVRGNYWTNAMDRFNNAVNSASDGGEISDGQYDRIMNTDLIASARRRESPGDVYIAFEASSKINRHDVDRAIQSRDAIQAAFKEAETLAAVYGREISDDDRRYAESVGAAVFISAPER